MFAGTIAAAVYNVNRDAKKHPKAWTHEDIFPQPKAPQSEAEVKAVFLNLAAAYSGKVEQDGGEHEGDDGAEAPDG